MTFCPLESRQALTLALAGVPRLGGGSPVRVLVECEPLFRVLISQARQWLMTDGVTWDSKRSPAVVHDSCSRKFVVIGTLGCGKSSVARKFVEPHEKAEDLLVYRPTIGVDLMSRGMQMGEEFGRIKVWDTGGDTRYRDAVMSFLSGADGVMVIFAGDGSDLEKQLGAMAPHRPDRCPVLIVGTKAHLHGDDVPESLWHLCKRHNAFLLPVRTCAFTGLNVELAFALLHALMTRMHRLLL